MPASTSALDSPPLGHRPPATATREQLADQRRLALESARMGWWHMELPGQEMTMDARCRAIFDVDAEDDPFARLLQRIHPEDRDRVAAAVEAALRPVDPAPYAAKYRVVWRDGSVRWVAARGQAAYEGEGAGRRAVSFSGTMADITEDKAAPELLRASEEKYRTLFNSIDEAFAVLEIIRDEEDQPVDYRFVEVNPAMERHTGWKAPQGRTARELIENLEPYWPETYGKVERTGESIRFVQGAAGMGRVFDAFAFRVGRPERPQVAILFRDITASHEAAEALRASEAYRRSIIESSPDCIKVLDLQGNLLSLDAGQALLGIPDVTPYLNTQWIDFWEHEKDRAAAHAAVAAAAGGEESRFTGFFRTLHGEDKWWNVVITPIPDATGRPSRLLAVSRDVTEQRKLEEFLHRRAEELTQADRSKDEFLAMLAHELRNPLAPLSNAALILNTPGASDDERAQAQRIIGRQIENMSRMIDDLLDVSRITEGKIELRKSPVSLESVLTAAASLVRSACASRKQPLTLSLPAEPVFLDADATRLEQVFGNLLGNASKYAGDGCRIELRAEHVGREVVVSVRDDGAGIAPELLPRIFDLFVQASRTLDRSHGGLGIGLTLVKRLVKLHGGEVEARSEGLGKGSEFIVRLPVLAQAPPPAAPSPAPSTPAIPRRVLIVDDNTDSARSLATLLKRRGHVTRAAFTGPEALGAAEEFAPDVVLLDIGLPGMDGFEVARRLRAIPALAQILLIAMTGYASTDDRAQAREAGFDEHLVKPIDFDTLRGWLAAHPRLPAASP